MKGWKRWKRDFGKRRTSAASQGPNNNTKQATLTAGSTISATSSSSSKQGTRKTNKKNVVGRKSSNRKTVHSKQSYSSTTGRNTRSGSRAISRTASKESQTSKKLTGKRNKSQISKQSVKGNLRKASRPKSESGSGSTSSSVQSTEPTAVTFQKTPIIVRRSFNLHEHSAVCDAAHDGRSILRGKFNIRIDELFDMLFSNKSAFLKEFHEMRDSRDLKLGEWVTQNGQRVRTVKVTVALQGNVGPKTSNVTEHQTLRKCSQPGLLYSIDVISINAGIPYADAFTVYIHFCLVSTVENSTDISIIAKVKFVKSVWAVIKTFIERNTYAGLEEFFQSMQTELHKHI